MTTESTPRISELAAEYQVHPNMLRTWCGQAAKALPSIFEKRDSLVDAQAAHTKQLEELYAEIGHLTTHVSQLHRGQNRCFVKSREGGAAIRFGVECDWPASDEAEERMHW